MPWAIWLARAAWITLPLTAGPAATTAIDHFDDAPRIVAGILLFASWGAGTVALLAPRPIGLTVLRAVAPAYLLVAIAAVVSDRTDGLEGWGAVAACAVASVLVSMRDVGRAAADGVAYGDEERFPLRVPPALFIAPLPAARVVAIAGIVAGPLLLADGQVVAGVLALFVGAAAAWIAWRALHTLSKRFFVIVPAGVVIIDPMTLSEPVLFLRRQIRGLQAVAPTANVSEDTLDLRLGAAGGNVMLELDEPVDMNRAGRRGRGGGTLRTAHILVAPAQRELFLERVTARRGGVPLR